MAWNSKTVEHLTVPDDWGDRGSGRAWVPKVVTDKSGHDVEVIDHSHPVWVQYWTFLTNALAL